MRILISLIAVVVLTLVLGGPTPAAGSDPGPGGTLITGDVNAEQAQAPAASGDTVVYVTKTGSKYHTAECRYLKKSKIKTTLKKAKQAGYEPCKVCKPPK